jgi:hypothetical protein
MIQPVSKRPFGHPVPALAIDYFCHPAEGHHYAQAAWGRDGKVYASNGWIAIRFFGFSAAFGPGPQTVVDRLGKHVWSNTYENPSAWRKLDDCTLDLFQEGVFENWKAQENGRHLYRIDPCVRINHGTLVPLVSLQLISRLPRCEIYTIIDRSESVRFRFNGGEGLIARLTHAQELQATPALCHLFPKQY